MEPQPSVDGSQTERRGGPPPQFKPLDGPQAPLTRKERRGVAYGRQWAGNADMPARSEGGGVVFVFGATLPTVAYALLYVCDLVLRADQSGDHHRGRRCGTVISGDRPGAFAAISIIQSSFSIERKLPNEAPVRGQSRAVRSSIAGSATGSRVLLTMYGCGEDRPRIVHFVFLCNRPGMQHSEDEDLERTIAFALGQFPYKPSHSRNPEERHGYFIAVARAVRRQLQLSWVFQKKPPQRVAMSTWRPESGSDGEEKS